MNVCIREDIREDCPYWQIQLDVVKLDSRRANADTADMDEIENDCYLQACVSDMRCQWAIEKLLKIIIHGR